MKREFFYKGISHCYEYSNTGYVTADIAFIRKEKPETSAESHFMSSGIWSMCDTDNVERLAVHPLKDNKIYRISILAESSGIS